MEVISIARDHDLYCPCGNSVLSDGFFPCDAEGNQVEPTLNSNWDGLYVCPVCSQIYRFGKPTYNHAYTLGFAVPGSEYEDWEDCLKYEKSKVINALLRRLGELNANNAEFLDALDGFDTYEE